MKKLLFISVVGISAFLISSETAFARISEKKSVIEGRMESKISGAYKYPIEDCLRKALELPYNKILLMQPLGTENSFYFKRPSSAATELADLAVPTDLVGWDTHFAYHQDISVMEFYRRHGDAMTEEEAETLMNLMLKAQKFPSYWVKTDFVPVLNRWDLKFENGKPKLEYYNRDGKKIDISRDAKTPLKDILPTQAQKIIYVEMQPDFKKSALFRKTVHFLIEEDALRAAYEEYDKLNDKRREYSSSKSTPGSSKARGSSAAQTDKGAANRKTVIAFKENPTREVESLFYNAENGQPSAISIIKYRLPNFFLGEREMKNREKKIQWTTRIPLQPDTSIGYNYETADGAIRAVVFENAILFMDTKFDQKMRKYMDELYEKQEGERQSVADESLSKF